MLDIAQTGLRHLFGPMARRLASPLAEAHHGRESFVATHRHQLIKDMTCR